MQNKLYSREYRSLYMFFHFFVWIVSVWQKAGIYSRFFAATVVGGSAKMMVLAACYSVVANGGKRMWLKK